MYTHVYINMRICTGTRKFHNFTSGKDANEANARRFISSFQAEDIVIMQGREYMALKIHGQSFMIHQVLMYVCVCFCVCVCICVCVYVCLCVCIWREYMALTMHGQSYIMIHQVLMYVCVYVYTLPTHIFISHTHGDKLRFGKWSEHSHTSFATGGTPTRCSRTPSEIPA